LENRFFRLLFVLYFIFPIFGYIYLAFIPSDVTFLNLATLVVFWVCFFIVQARDNATEKKANSIFEIWILIAGFQLVILPLIVAFSGISYFRLTRIVSNDSLVKGTLLFCFAYVLIATGILIQSRRSFVVEAVGTTSKLTLILSRYLFCGGIVGVSSLVYLRYINRGDLDGIFSNESNFLLKFLAITFSPWLFYWTVNKIVEFRVGSKLSQVATIRFGLLILITILPLTLLNLSRAALLVPLLCFLILVSPPTFSPKNSLRWLSLLVVAGVFASLIGNYRAEMKATQNNRYSASSIGFEKNPGMAETLQLYGNSPQYLSYGIEYIDPTDISILTPFFSIVEPLPKLNILNRNRLDGTSIFNEAVYQNASVRDLYFSPVGEVYLSWGLFGMVIFFLSVGFGLQKIFRTFLNAQSRFLKFCLLLAGFWLSLSPMLSISVLTQVMFYTVLPPLFLEKMLRNKFGVKQL
jgi:hypothetical protein